MKIWNLPEIEKRLHDVWLAPEGSQADWSEAVLTVLIGTLTTLQHAQRTLSGAGTN